MSSHAYNNAYNNAAQHAGAEPIESGVLCKLADNECPHGRLPNDHTKPCGCWPEKHQQKITDADH